MRIAFDLDGVLADLHTPFAEAALRLFPELDPATVQSPEVGASAPDDETDEEEPGRLVVKAPPDLALSRRQSDAVWRHLESIENFWETLEEHEPGTIAALASMADAERWEVLFITSRPTSKGRTVQRQSQEWLARKGFPLPSLYVVHGSRGRIADALHLDVVVDDRPENCLDIVLESKASAILVWRGSERTVPASARRLGIAVVPTVKACLESLTQAAKGGSRGGLIDRLRGLFNLPARSAGGSVHTTRR